MKAFEHPRINLSLLLILQTVYGFMAISFLFVSGWYAHTTGKALSAAPVVPSGIMFVIYMGCLLLPGIGRIGWYRVMMTLAIIPFGIGGVLMNIMNFLQNGLRDFSSVEIWFIAWGINLFGTIWNIVTAVGAFEIKENL